MRAGKTWTDEELATLHVMRREGSDAQSIASVLGRSVDAVRTKGAEIGMPLAPVPLRKWQRTFTKAEKAALHALFKGGCKRRQVSELLELHENDVVGCLKFNGLYEQYKAATNLGRRNRETQYTEADERNERKRIIAASAELRDRVLALYRRERMAA